jgi:flagellar biosynthesis GTPase FlhF
MRDARDPNRGQKRNYIPNDDIDREEKAARRQQKKGSVIGILLGGVIVLSLIAFIFVLLDSGLISTKTHPIYGNQQQAEAQKEQLTQEEKKQREEEARKAEEERKKKEREEQAAREEAEERERQAKQEEEEKQQEEEAARKKEKPEEREAEEKKRQEEMKKEMEQEQTVLSGDYILPDSSSRYYSESELNGLTDREVLFALNEIYARKGRIFTGEEFKRYFESKSWYKGTIPADEFDANQNDRFNEYEKANIALLVKIAEERGLR